jgi:shikimate kinase/3-dehydroquinate synthase
VVGALDRHLVLIGFMGAGKSTVGAEVARLTERAFVDTDEEIERRHGSVADLFAAGEPEFRGVEEVLVGEVLARREPAVVALGGGAVTTPAVREQLRTTFTVWLPVTADVAWERVRESGRPLARDERSFRELFAEREALYDEVADAAAGSAAEVVRKALGIEISRTLFGRMRFAAAEPMETVADEQVLDLHRPNITGPVHSVPGGPQAKTLAVAERLWGALRLDRNGTLIAIGGGSTTDVAGFVAATYLRGVPWIAVPTTLTGQVDAAIGGKTGIDLGGKNLVGAFHFPERVFIDPDVLRTLPADERRAGLAEVVKTGLLAGHELWALEEEEMIAACAAYKASVVLSDPYEQGRRAVLNLGHTFGHALEAASGSLRHGDAVALGLLAALRLSGLGTADVEEVLAPEPVRVDPELAWAALLRDKKRADGEVRLVLLDAPGQPKVEAVPEADVRRALESLIAH